MLGRPEGESPTAVWEEGEERNEGPPPTYGVFASLLVLLARYEHVAKGRQAAKNGATDPRAEAPLRRRPDPDGHGCRRQLEQLLADALADARKHRAEWCTECTSS